VTPETHPKPKTIRPSPAKTCFSLSDSISVTPELATTLSNQQRAAGRKLGAFAVRRPAPDPSASTRHQPIPTSKNKSWGGTPHPTSAASIEIGSSSHPPPNASRVPGHEHHHARATTPTPLQSRKRTQGTPHQLQGAGCPIEAWLKNQSIRQAIASSTTKPPSWPQSRHHPQKEQQGPGASQAISKPGTRATVGRKGAGRQHQQIRSRTRRCEFIRLRTLRRSPCRRGPC